MPAEGFLEHHDYKKLYAYQKSVLVYDITQIFCRRFLNPRDRTVDQMVQAARSGKQNIIEGTKASATSTEMEIKLLNVARASQEELLEDYHDYLRTHDHVLWHKDSIEAKAVRELPHSIEADTNGIYKSIGETRPAETLANVAICLIHQTNYLLDRQIRKLEQDFLKQGGVRERMTKARLTARRS